MTATRAAHCHGFQSVVFDCDSTLVQVEGIDELAGAHREQVRALTDAAMAGAVPLDEVYGRRLTLIRPTREAVAALGRIYLAALVPDAAATVAGLLWLGKDVRIVSGGLLQPVLEVARALGIPEGRVAAVEARFGPDGAYAGFDTASLLSRSGGKTRVLSAWKLPRPSLLVGDGATDLEARPAVDAFAAFTGVVCRDAVVAAADFRIPGPSLAAVLALAAGKEDRARLAHTAWEPLLHAGDILLNRP